MTIAARNPAALILAGRNLERCQETADLITKQYPAVKIKLLQLYLSNLSAVRNAAQKVQGWNDLPAIDVLVNNAGIMAVPFQLSRLSESICE